MQDGARWLGNKVKEFIWGPTQNPPLQQPTLSPSQQPPKSLPELLKEHDLPLGLFPKNITGYNFDVNTRIITVNMSGIFDVSILRFSNTVTGCLERGRLKNINGIRTVGFTWVDVHCIKIKTISRKLHLHFTGGQLDKVCHFDKFETLKDGIPV